MSDPIRLEPLLASGALLGAGDRYEKRLEDLAGLYRDEAAYLARLEVDDGRPVYWVESSTPDVESGALTIGTSVLMPGRIGAEFAMTRGHIHARRSAAELYFGLSGRGVMLMETVDGRSRVIEITPGVAVHVPGYWVHRSVNVGTEPFTTLFCYPSDAGQDYRIIEDAGGMATLVVADGEGWALRQNPDHIGYRGDDP